VGTKEERLGIAATLALHGLAAVLFLLVRFGESLQEPEFIELSWGASSVGVAMPELSREASSSAQPAVPVQQETRSLPLSLPERRFAGDQDRMAVERQEKLDAPESPVAAKPSKRPEETLRRDSPLSTSPGATVDQAGTGRNTAGGTGSGSTVAGSAGTGVSFALEWSEGGTRKKMSGALPSYPSGVSVEAQIKLETIVAPDGSVTRVRPVQRGNARLEEAAMKEVWQWKFEPLRANSRQVDQMCYITFNFRLR
jgi:TonB family protein